jgi:hypothetical protein
MLKPDAKKIATQAETADLIAAFKQRGGVIVKVESGVAEGLKRRKYLKRDHKKSA